MKPSNAIQARIACDLSTTAFEYALEELKCFPICTLRVAPNSVYAAARVLGVEFSPDTAHISPRVNVVIDETYSEYEWSVEYDGRVWWSPGC